MRKYIMLLPLLLLMALAACAAPPESELPAAPEAEELALTPADTPEIAEKLPETADNAEETAPQTVTERNNYDPTFAKVFNEEEFLAELGALRLVESATVEWRNEDLAITVRLNGPHTTAGIVDIFETIQWLVDHGDSFSANKAADFPHPPQWLDEHPRTDLLILAQQGETLYHMRNGQEIWERRDWQALSWPEGEQEFSFLYEHITANALADNFSTQPEYAVPEIDGIPVFTCADWDFLPQTLGFSIYDSIKDVHKAAGQPQQISAIYYVAVMDNAYPHRQNVLNAYYSFGYIQYMFDYSAAYIVLNQSGLAGPRGIYIGSPYEQVLAAFPQEKVSEEAPNRLYPSGDNLCYYSTMLIDDENNGEITYEDSDNFLIFEIENGLVTAISIGEYLGC